MPEGGVDDPDVDMIPAPLVTTERKQEDASDHKYSDSNMNSIPGSKLSESSDEEKQDSNKYYKTEFEKDFKIS